MKQELDQSRNFQMFLVGAENTGKTSLVSSFLGEEFVEGQSATKGADVEVCKVYCKDWIRINHSDKSDILHNQFAEQCRDGVLKIMSSPSISPPQPSSCNPPTRDSGIMHSDMLFSSVRLTESMMAPPVNGARGNHSKLHPQHAQEVSIQTTQCDSESLIASLWDFPGQVIFHNTHSVFISDGGVCVITFNASVELTNKIIPREGSPQPPECCTIISSIHYWLQVVNSVCSVKENVLLVGTHIDKLHPDLKEAHKIAREAILPVLEKELFRKPYSQHIACISKGLRIALEQSCFFISNKCRDKFEIQRLQAAAVTVATSLREKWPVFFLKIEQALLQLSKEFEVISTAKMLDLVIKATFPIDESSSEFKGILKYFHANRVILHFSEIESLKDVVILSPHWLAKLFSYVIAAHSYKTGSEFDGAWERLTKYGILRAA